MRVLFVTVNRGHRVAFNLFTPLQKELATLCDMDIYEKQVGIHGRKYQQEFFKNPNSYIKELDISNINNNYDVVITDALFAFMGEDWNLVTIPKFTLIEDQHNQCMNIVRTANSIFHKFDYFIVRYRDAFYDNHPTINRDRIIWSPHAVDVTFFKDYQEPRSIYSLTTGSIAGSIYPLREKVYNEMKSSGHYQRIDRPVEGMADNKWPIGRDYAKLLSSSLISFACNSIYKYPVMKIFEIPACRSVLCCDYTDEMNDLGFVPDINMLEISMDMDIQKFITLQLKDKQRLENIATRGLELIQERHTVQIRAKQLYDLIRKIYE
jgi:hypothetical protein